MTMKRSLELVSLVTQTPGAPPVCLWGGSGEGKTTLVYALAKHLDKHLETVITSFRGPEEFCGLPIPCNGQNGKVHIDLAPPGWVERVVEAGGGIVFYDEVGCFLGGTVISTPHGAVKIENLSVGDSVLGRNVDSTHIRSNIVERVIRKEVSQLVKIEIPGKVIICTPDHKFAVVDRDNENLFCDWIEAKDLRMGSHLRLGRELATTLVRRITDLELSNSVSVYDLTTSPDHNYIANNVLVHNCAPPAVQAALLRPLFEGVVGDVALPGGTLQIAAANPPDVAAGGWDQAPPLAARFWHHLWSGPTAEELGGYLMSGAGDPFGKLPTIDREKWEKAYKSRAAPLMAGFLRASPGMVREDPKAYAGRFPLAFACPRTIEAAARLIATAESIGDSDAVMELVEGSCGEGFARAYCEFSANMNLPEPEEVLRNPDGWSPDASRPDESFITLSAVASLVMDNGKVDAARWARAFHVIWRAEALGDDVMAVPVTRLMSDRDKRPKSLNGKPILKSDPVIGKVAARLQPVLRAAGLTSGE